MKQNEIKKKTNGTQKKRIEDKGKTHKNPYTQTHTHKQYNTIEYNTTQTEYRPI